MRIYYTSDGTLRTGGQRVNLEHVLALRRVGYDARLWLMPAKDAPVRLPTDLGCPAEASPALDPADVVVFGEMFAQAAAQLRDAPVRKVMHNQGSYLTFEVFRDLEAIRAAGVEAMLTVSQHSAAMLQRMGWAAPLHVISPALDPAFRPDPAVPRTLRVAAVTTKRFRELRLIRGIVLSRRPDLAEVPWFGIAGVSRGEVARRMQESEIFLALGEREGLGLPPLEALATGALAAGFHGGGGLAYATPANGDWFDDHQHFEVAEALVALIDGLRAGERFEARRDAGIAAAAAFSPQAFEAQLAQAWRRIAGAP